MIPRSVAHTNLPAAPLVGRSLTLLGLVACLLFAAASSCSSRPRQPVDGRLRVVTTFTVIADMARNVAGERAVVESITKPGAEIHDYEPTPGDIAKAQGAGLVLHNGLGLERWFERFMQRLSETPQAVLTSKIEPLGIGEGPYSGKPNPHAWMSPVNALLYVEAIRDALIAVDPAGAEIYKANAEAYSRQIRDVDESLRDGLATIPAAQRVLVTSEGAFTYLCRDYGIKELYLWPVNADQEGTPQQVKRVIDAVRAAAVPVVFSESTISDKAMRQVAAETGARYGGVLYVDSLTDANGPAPTYLQLLRANTQTIRSGFGVPAPAPLKAAPTP